jgi:hypothetical protein
MVGLMHLPSVTELFLAHPPTYLTTWSGVPMQLATEAAPFRRLCDVHLKPFGGAAVVGIAMMRLSAALHRQSPLAFRMNSQICPDGRSTVRSWVRQRTPYPALHKNA